MKLEEDCTEGLVRITSIFYDRFDTAKEMERKLAEFIDGHPTFEREFSIFDENAGNGTPAIQSGVLEKATGRYDARVSSEWDFALAYGYKEGVLDVITTLDSRVTNLPFDDALEEVDHLEV